MRFVETVSVFWTVSFRSKLNLEKLLEQGGDVFGTKDGATSGHPGFNWPTNRYSTGSRTAYKRDVTRALIVDY
jgi:hypothetical protein